MLVLGAELKFHFYLEQQNQIVHYGPGHLLKYQVQCENKS